MIRIDGTKVWWVKKVIRFLSVYIRIKTFVTVCCRIQIYTYGTIDKGSADYCSLKQFDNKITSNRLLQVQKTGKGVLLYALIWFRKHLGTDNDPLTTPLNFGNSNYYWSSTEMSSSQAVAFQFAAAISAKTNKYPVRAFRSF